MRPFYTEGSSSFITSTVASVATGRSEPVSRAGLAPAVDQRLFTAHSNQWLTSVIVSAAYAWAHLPKLLAELRQFAVGSSDF